MTRRRIVAAAVAVWAALMVVLAIMWYAYSADRLDSVAGVQAAAVVWVIVGAILAIRIPANLVGSLALAAGSAWVVYLFGNRYAATSLTTGGLPGDYTFAWIGAWVGALLPLGVSGLMLVFPSGRVVGSWRLLTIPLFAGLVSTIVGATLLWGTPIHTLIDSGLISQIEVYAFVDAGFIIGFVSSVPAALSLVARYRRAALVERQQIKWLLAATCLFVLTYVIAASTDDGNETFWWLLSVALGAIPLAIVFAVLRYRLYDIDRIISRTVTYTIVAILLAGGVAGVATLVGAQFDRPWIVASTTLAVAALFNPLRGRVQDWVDRRFHRSSYDAAHVIDTFAGSLRDRVDVELVVDGWVNVVEDTMQPAAIAVWVKNSR